MAEAEVPLHVPLQPQDLFDVWEGSTITHRHPFRL